MAVPTSRSTSSDGRTPLEAARMPRLAALAARGDVGRAAVIPPGLPPGSDVGNMAILGFDPARYHTGRAPIEAAAMGVELAPDEVAYRCNLVTLSDDDAADDGRLRGRSPHERAEPPDRRRARSRARWRPRRRALPSRRRVPPPVRRAERLVRRRVHAAARPHRHARRVPDRARGAEAARAHGCVARGGAAQPRHDVGASATQIWLWGQGVKPALPQFDATYGVAGRMSSAVDLVQGLGVLTGIEVVDVPGATAGFDNDYTAQARRVSPFARRSRPVRLARRGNRRGRASRARAREGRRARAVGRRRDRPDRRRARRRGSEPFRILLLPDHATPCTIKTHTAESVPYLLFDSTRDGRGGIYTEPATAPSPPVPAHELMGRLLTVAQE